jgi:hypothetical protein
MANPNNGNDPPATDQNTPERLAQIQHRDVMTRLAEMRQDANAAITAMQQWMDATTRQLQLGLHVRIYPPFDPNRSGALEQRWDMGLSDMPPDDQRRFHTYIGSRIAAAENITTQTPGGEGVSAPSQANQGDGSMPLTEADRTRPQTVNQSPPDDVPPLNARSSRVRKPEEVLCQTGARKYPTTSATQSNADPIIRTPMQPSITVGQAPSAMPEVRQPQAQEPSSHQPNMSTSDKGKRPAVDGIGRNNLDRSGDSRSQVETDDLSNTIPSSNPKPKIPRQTSTSNVSGSANPKTGTSTGRRNTVADTQSTGLGSLYVSLGDSDEKQRKNSRYGFRRLGAVKKEKTPEYKSDHEMEPVKGYKWIIGNVKPKNINDDAPQVTTSRRTKETTTAGSESTEGAQNSTLMQPEARGRTKSSPSLTTMPARSESIDASRVPEDAESDRSDDDEQPRKHRKANVFEDIEDGPQDDTGSSSSSSEDDGNDGDHGAQIGNRKPSNSSDDGDVSRDVFQADQRPGLSTLKSAQGNKGQRVERQGKRNAPSTKPRARGPQSEESNTGGDDIHNQDKFELLKPPSASEVAEAARTLNEVFGSDNDGSEAPILDEQFQESLIDDPIPEPEDEDEEASEEGEEEDDGIWEDGIEAKNVDEAHVFSKRPKTIIKHTNGRGPTTGYGSRHGSFATSWVVNPANDGKNVDDRPARTGEKRKSNSPTQGEESDGKVPKLCTPQQRSALTYQQKKKPPSDYRKRNRSRTEQSQFQLLAVSSDYIRLCDEMVLIITTEKK